MTNTTYIAWIIVGIAGVTFFARAFPFLFAGAIRHHPTVSYVGKYLPGSIMLLLVMYCMKDISITKAPFALPELIALAWIAAIQIWKRHILLSISTGTALFFVLRYFLL